MKEDEPSEKPAIVPDPSIVQPPAAPGGMDPSGWSQPPAPQSPGPPGAFVDRPAAPPGAALPRGRGAPVQPGPPLSVESPIKDTTINLTAVGLLAVIVIVAIIVVVVVISLLTHH